MVRRFYKFFSLAISSAIEVDSYLNTKTCPTTFPLLFTVKKFSKYLISFIKVVTRVLRFTQIIKGALDSPAKIRKKKNDLKMKFSILIITLPVRFKFQSPKLIQF